MYAAVRNFRYNAVFSGIVFLAFWSFAAAFVHAQSPSAPADDFVIEKAATSLRFNSDGTGEQERTFTIRIQSEAAVRALGVLSCSQYTKPNCRFVMLLPAATTLR
jgi:hypothetical protein